MIRKIEIIEAGHADQMEYLANPVSGKFESIRFPTTVALIEHSSRGLLLFDTGVTPRLRHLLKRFPDHLFSNLFSVETDYETTAVHQLRTLGIRPDEIRHLVLSHFHSDHIAGVNDFPEARIFFSAEEYRAMCGLSRIGRLRHAFVPELLPSDLVHRRAEPGSETELVALGPGFRGRDLFGDGSLFLVPLPGHSLGHQGLFVPDYRGKAWFFVGDAAHLSSSIRDGTPPVALGAKLIFHDTGQYNDTLGRLRNVPETVCLLPCHCNEAFQRAKTQLVSP
jgi:glyoxylase-like metal-dependent hydrolase (beta-lactamase superfamily II)